MLKLVRIENGSFLSYAARWEAEIRYIIGKKAIIPPQMEFLKLYPMLFDTPENLELFCKGTIYNFLDKDLAVLRCIAYGNEALHGYYDTYQLALGVAKTIDMPFPTGTVMMKYVTPVEVLPIEEFVEDGLTIRQFVFNNRRYTLTRKRS